MNPLRAFPGIFSPATCRRGIVSQGTCRRGLGNYVPGDSAKCKFPFLIRRKESWAGLMYEICMTDPPQAPSTASTEFQDFVRCCLQIDPARRWTAAQLLRHPFVTGEH
ncbi:mitogen-activated protein kinase kinase 5-like protein [Tanacetum coccineum]